MDNQPDMSVHVYPVPDSGTDTQTQGQTNLERGSTLRESGMECGDACVGCCVCDTATANGISLADTDPVAVTIDDAAFGTVVDSVIGKKVDRDGNDDEDVARGGCVFELIKEEDVEGFMDELVVVSWKEVEEEENQEENEEDDDSDSDTYVSCSEY